MLRQARVSGHAHPVRGVHQPGLIIHPCRCSLDSGHFFLCLPNGRNISENSFRNPLNSLRHSPFSFLISGARLQHGEGEGRKGKAPSHSWFGWNLIWRAALGSSHSCHQSKNNRKQLCIWAALILRNLRLWRVTPCVLWQLCDWNRFEMRFEGVKRGERSAFVSHRSAGKTDTQRETPPTNTDTYRAPRPPTLKQTDGVPPSRCRLGKNVFLVPPCFFYDTSIIFPREVGRRNKL